MDRITKGNGRVTASLLFLPSLSPSSPGQLGQKGKEGQKGGNLKISSLFRPSDTSYTLHPLLTHFFYPFPSSVPSLERGKPFSFPASHSIRRGVSSNEAYKCSVGLCRRSCLTRKGTIYRCPFSLLGVCLSRTSLSDGKGSAERRGEGEKIALLALC